MKSFKLILNKILNKRQQNDLILYHKVASLGFLLQISLKISVLFHLK